MAETTGIPWCDATWNPWIGCQKVSAGCLNCYAEKLAHFHGWVKEWGKDYKLTSDSNWKNPIQWAKKAVKDGVIRRVFCASLADVFDDNIPNIWWRKNLWELIDETGKIGGLEWLLLTKRPENIDRFIPWDWRQSQPNYVRIGITCENQEMADKRIVELFKNWHGKNFISVEPMLSAVNLRNIRPVNFKNRQDDVLTGKTFVDNSSRGAIFEGGQKIDWVIAGCESGTNARPCNIEWVRDLRDQCQMAEVPFFLKQLNINGKLTKEPVLDGRQWLEFPKGG